MSANGYRLSARAAAAEAQRLERKAYTTSNFPTLQEGRQDGDNFVKNMVTKISLDRSNDTDVSVQTSAVGLSATWACVSFWAGNIASLPMAVQRKGPVGVAVDDPTHPLYWLLHDSPNSDQSAYDFWEFMVASLELRGNAYAELGRRGDGSLISLTPVPPNLMGVVRQPNGSLQYRWQDNYGPHVVDQADMLHVRGFGGGPLGGVSPLSACRQAFSSAVSVDRAASTMFGNGVRSSGVMSADKQLNKEQRDYFEQLLQEKFVGAANAGRPMLLDGGLKWEQLSIDPHDAEMLESRRFSTEEVCRVFEVDPHMVGQTSGNTTLGSSIDTQTLSVLKFKMRKRLKRIEGAAEKQLLSPTDRLNGVSIRFNLEAYLRADTAARAQFYQTMTQIGAMTINEVRALEGLPPVAGGDVPRMQMQNVPIGHHGAPPLDDKPAA